MDVLEFSDKPKRVVADTHMGLTKRAVYHNLWPFEWGKWHFRYAYIHWPTKNQRYQATILAEWRELFDQQQRQPRVQMTTVFQKTWMKMGLQPYSRDPRKWKPHLDAFGSKAIKKPSRGSMGKPRFPRWGTLMFFMTKDRDPWSCCSSNVGETPWTFQGGSWCKLDITQKEPIFQEIMGL